ncbi:UNVERIFIED_CONTAM: DNA mismatch repair protein MSH5 [Sesamum calycinum]|uniref:DNA mismatch repair protein MSH5 n=1 Tax=Sesamum calycinum TaxID=2727403 RepID=A0AAW2Q4Z0_9LAMI
MEEVDETDVESQVYMACIMHGQRVGISYYDSSICQLHVLEFWEDGNEDFPLVEMVKYQAQPCIIYTSTKCEQSLLAALQNNDGNAEAPTVKLVKSSLFSYEQAWHRNWFLRPVLDLEKLNIRLDTVMGVIDVNRSKDKGYDTIVKDGFCGELDELRQIYEELPEFLEEKLLQYFEVIFAIFNEEKLNDNILEKLQDFEFAFSDEDGDSKKFFYRTAKTRELDDLLGDIYHKILDMERAITRDLVTHVLQFSDPLLKAVTFTAELDCSLSLALVARQNNYVRPILTSESVLDIRNGRIFCAMGSKFMTAEQSTFMIDLQQVGMMLRHASYQSLCLVDEFGKGTLSEDGVGLLGGTINYFASCDNPPKVMLSTHLSEIFESGCLVESSKIKYYTMSVLSPDDKCTDVEDIVFLYRLVPGRAHLSYGVSEEVVKRAASVLIATGDNKNVDRLLHENILAQDQQYKEAVEKMLAFDTSNGDLRLFFEDIFPSQH